MGPLVVVELQKVIEGALERTTTGKVLPPKRDAPVLCRIVFYRCSTNPFVHT